MLRATACSDRLTEYFQSLEGVVDESQEMEIALEGEQRRRAQELKSEAAVAVGDAKRELLEKVDKMESHLNRIRAFKAEAKGDAATQLVFQKMADYSDQFFSGSQFTMNVYYVCKARKTHDNPNGCRGLIRADCWTQLLTIEEEMKGGKQRWYCHCGARYMTGFGVCVEMVDHEARPPQAWYLQAALPQADMKDLKTLLRYDKLKKQGIECLTPADLLKHLPKVEPLAQGDIFDKYCPGDPQWEGHFQLSSKLSWDDLPEFDWTDLYGQCYNPEWANWSKKARNKAKRELLERAQTSLLEYERRHGLAAGSLLGAGGAGVAPCANRAEEGGPPPPPTGAGSGTAVPPPPPRHAPPQGEEALQPRERGLSHLPCPGVPATPPGEPSGSSAGASGSQPPPPAGPPPAEAVAEAAAGAAGAVGPPPGPPPGWIPDQRPMWRRPSAPGPNTTPPFLQQVTTRYDIPERQ